MRALAAAVGLRESALYHHFPSKEALLREALATPTDATPGGDPGGAGGAGQTGRGESGASAGPTAPIEALDRPRAEIFLELVLQISAAYGTPRRRKQLRALLAAGGSPDEETWRQLTEEPRRRLARVLQRLRRAGRVRDDLDLDSVHLLVVAPLLFATGVLAPGRKPPITIPQSRFLQQHAVLLAQALAPPARTGRKH